METKKCISCGLEKEINCFSYRKDIQTYRNQCKECRTKKDKERIYNNKEKYEHYVMYHKEYRNNNKIKINKYAEKYRKANKDIIKSKQKQYYIKNKEYLKAKAKEYRLLNKENISKKKYESKKRKLDNDVIYKLKEQTRNMIYQCFRKRHFKKNTKAEQILGCDLNYFVKHLLITYKNKYGINWDKQELIEIDHIIPLATARTEEEVKALCHYTNLQLLKKKDNRDKSDKIL